MFVCLPCIKPSVTPYSMSNQTPLCSLILSIFPPSPLYSYIWHLCQTNKFPGTQAFLLPCFRACKHFSSLASRYIFLPFFSPLLPGTLVRVRMSWMSRWACQLACSIAVVVYGLLHRLNGGKLLGLQHLWPHNLPLPKVAYLCFCLDR